MTVTMTKRTNLYLCVCQLLGLLVSGSELSTVQVLRTTTRYNGRSFYDLRPVNSDSVILSISYRSCNYVGVSFNDGTTVVEVRVLADRLTAEHFPLGIGLPRTRAGTFLDGTGFSCTSDRTLLVAWKRTGHKLLAVRMQPPLPTSEVTFKDLFHTDLQGIHVWSFDSVANWTLTVRSGILRQPSLVSTVK